MGFVEERCAGQAEIRFALLERSDARRARAKADAVRLWTRSSTKPMPTRKISADEIRRTSTGRTWGVKGRGGVILGGAYEGTREIDNVDLRGCEIEEGSDLSGCDLSELNMTGCIARRVNFSRCNLRCTDLRGANLTGAIFDRAAMDGCSLALAHWHHARFRFASMVQASLVEIGRRPHGAEWVLEKEDGKDIPDEQRPVPLDRRWEMWRAEHAKDAVEKEREEDLAAAERWEAWKTGWMAEEIARHPHRQSMGCHVDMQGARCTDMRLRKGNCHMIHMACTELVNAILDGADLDVSNLRGAILIGASMKRTELYDARLEKANFADADLEDAILVGAAFTPLALSAKLPRPPPASSWSWGMTVAKAAAKEMMSANDDCSDSDGGSGDEDDEEEGDDGGTLSAAAAAAMDKLAEEAANALPQVAAAYSEATGALQAAASEWQAAAAFDGKVAQRVRELRAESQDIEASAALVRGFLHEDLRWLLDRVVALVEQRLQGDEAGAAMGGGLSAELARVALGELRAALELVAAPLIKRIAQSVALHALSSDAGRAAQAAASLAQKKAAVHDEAASGAAGGLRQSLAAAAGELIHGLQKGIDPTALAKEWAARRGSEMLRRAGLDRRLGSLGKRIERVEKRMLAHAGAAAVLGGRGTLARAVESEVREGREVRAAIAARATRLTSQFLIRGVSDLLRLLLRTKPSTLVKHENELEYLSHELSAMREKDITGLGWLDFFESFQSLLSLRAQQTDPCCLQILDALVADVALRKGLAMAQGLSGMKSVEHPPAALLQALKKGPGKHLKVHAYSYRRRIDQELVRIRRVQKLQDRAVSLAGLTITSAMVGLFSFLSRYAYEALVENRALFE